MAVLFVLFSYACSAAGQEALIPPGTLNIAEPGLIRGIVLDGTGASLPGAAVTLKDDRTGDRYSTKTDALGEFAFKGLQADAFTATASATGFDAVTANRVALAAGQNLELPPMMLHVASVSATVDVTASLHDVAEAQMKSEEKQRVLGVLPNYYVVYYPNPAPLSAGQKMRLALRQTVDPVSFAVDAAVAGLQMNSKNYAAYGSGGEGFAKRFGAAYASDSAGTLIGSGLFPVLLHQDPRYHYKGTGSVSSRMLYALSWSFRCKGDNGEWQFAYSSVLGNAAVTGLSELYEPKAIRDSGPEMLKSSLINLASQAVSSVFQEFVLKKVTSHADEPGKGGAADVSGSGH